jgi:hypothetical protein
VDGAEGIAEDVMKCFCLPAAFIHRVKCVFDCSCYSQ